MRTLKVLTVAALLAAVASAGSLPGSVSAAAAQARRAAHGPRIASDKLPSTVLSKHYRKLRESTHAAARGLVAQHRDMRAQQSAECDNTAFADATARVLQACPTLSGLVSGATSMAEFLPGFCGSECYNTIRTELAVHTACLDETTLFLVAFVDTCVNRPQCFSENFIVGGPALDAECGQIMQDTLDVENSTAAAAANARLGCSGTCVSRQLSFFNTYSVCFEGSGGTPPATMSAMQGFVNAMCTDHNGEVCAVHLKNFGAFECKRDRSGSCDATRCDSRCQPIFNTANLDLACTPCNERLIPHLSAIGEDPTSTAAGLEMMCSKLDQTAAVSDTNPYCFPVALATMAAGGQWSTYDPATTCAATGAKQCTERVIGLTATAGLSEARATLLDCIARADLAGFVSPSPGGSSTTACVFAYETVARSAVQIAATGKLLCSQNAANDYCYTRAIEWTVLAATTCSSCSSACASAVPTQLTATGCCAAKINDWIRYTSTSYPASYLPAGTHSGEHMVTDDGETHYLTSYSYSHTPMFARTQLTRADQPMAMFAVCGGNGTALWDQIEGRCPTTLASPPSASFRVTLAWSRVAANPAVKRNLEQSLSDDAARNANVNPDQIVNGTLVEGSGTVQERSTGTTAAAASRRQTTTTTSDCNFQFQIDAADAATADAAVAAIDEKVTAGTLLTPQTSATVVSTCEECLDARSTSLVSASAPAPGAPPSSSSSARAFAFAGAVAAAVASALLF